VFRFTNFGFMRSFLFLSDLLTGHEPALAPERELSQLAALRQATPLGRFSARANIRPAVWDKPRSGCTIGVSRIMGRSARGTALAILAMVILAASLLSAHAYSGAAVPWTTYEAENMTVSGGLVLGPQYAPNVITSESSGRKCVALIATGQYVEFAAQAVANAMVIRYSVPDTANGVGTNYTLSLYTNGVFAEKLPLSSRYSWLYGNYPFTNNPLAGSPRNFYDEFRTNGLTINPGDVVRLQKDSSDTATSYTIDLIDLENVPAPLSQPSNSVSILSYGAGGQGTTDDTAALKQCIIEALSLGRSVWLPAGNYKITSALSLPSHLTMQGAGMWYTVLSGDPLLYTNSSRRVALIGNGSSLHLADFAIVGKLNYRNDSEPSDGLGGAYGTGSSISRLWVEHTKTGAWIVNSSGLVVDSCRFRDTLADGINLCVGMQNTIVTNCTARGTGDDCFPIWPTDYTAQSYTPGSNLITHCTGQTPFLANGGAIYGAAGNQIEACQFLDITYGCGILLSTTFPVGTNIFSGATTVQDCDVIRCGGYDPGYGWRAAVQLCVDTYTNGITGVKLINLNLTNNVSDGLSVVGGTGVLIQSLVAGVSIPNYGLGVSGGNALWARNDAAGSLTVSNSAIAEYLDGSSRFAFHFTNMVAGPAAALAFNIQPGYAVAGVPFGQQPALKTVDLYGNFTTSGLPASLVAHVLLTNGVGTLSGSLACDLGTAAGDGTAAFTNLTINAVGTNDHLLASVTTSSPSISNTLSAPFNVQSLPPSPGIQRAATGGNSLFSLTIDTTPGYPYHLVTTTNLAVPAWTPVPGSGTNAQAASAAFTDPSPVTGQRFYRAVSP